MNAYTVVGVAELLLGTLLLLGCGFAAAYLPGWLLRPPVMRALAIIAGLALLGMSAGYVIYGSKSGSVSSRALTFGALGLLVLFSSRAALDEEALRAAERVSRWQTDRRLALGLAALGVLLLLIGLITLRNGLLGLTA